VTPGVGDAIVGCRAAHRRLIETVVSVTDDDVGRPSRLPDWTVGHVLTHLARNADSHVRMLEAAARGDVVDQYPGGDDERAADIQAGAARPASVLAADVRQAAMRLEAKWAATPAGVWANGAGRMGGNETAVAELPFLRWREVEVHHADLGLAFSWRDWSDAYVGAELERTVAELPARLPPGLALRLEPTDEGRAWTVPADAAQALVVARPRRELLAWLLGRAGEHDPALPSIGRWQRAHPVTPGQDGRGSA
jgi:maleylpyruvate isomerase